MSNWLQRFIETAITERMCTRLYCTTCGAFTFRRGVLKALSAQTGLPYTGGYDGRAAEAIVEALAEVVPPEGLRSEFEDALRLMLVDMWDGLVLFDRRDAERRLAGSWAGSVLGSMVAHSRAREARRAAAPPEESREEIERRKAEQKRLRQLAHQQRLEAKKERDRLWWEQHPRPS